MTGRRVQTGLERSKRSKQNVPPRLRCRRAAGARAESCNYTLSLSARDTARQGRIRAIQSHGDSSFINSVAVVVVVVTATIIIVVVTIIIDVAMHLTFIKFDILLMLFG